MRRITKPLALLLALVMVIGLLPAMAFAAESGTASVTVSATDGWDDYSGTAEVSLPFGKSGNKVKVWTDSVGINISAIAVNGDTKSLTDAAVEVQGADFNGSAVENLHNDGSYAVIDLDALGFGNLSGTQNVAFTYATEHDGFELHAVSYYADEQPEENSAPTAEPNEVPADTELEVAEFAGETGYQKVTVTGVATTGGWNSTDTSYQNWFTVKGVQLDPNGAITVSSGNRSGINISAIEIGGNRITITALKNSVTVNGKDGSDNPVKLEEQAGGWQIAHLEIPGVSATIRLSDFGIEAGTYEITFIYAVADGYNTDFVVESSVGSGETTVTYDSTIHGNPGGTYDPPTGTGSTTPERQSVRNNDQTNPQKAIWFFDSHEEQKSFDVKQPDAYWDILEKGKHQNNLTLYSSTDGTIRNNGSGELWINWENQYRTSAPELGGNVRGNGYSDGSYTIVGWGGEFEGGSDKARNAIRFRVKDNGDDTLLDALTHLSIYLVDSDGKIIDKVWLKNAAGNDTSLNSLHYVSTADDGYCIYEATLSGDYTMQGIKLAFDRYSAEFGEDANTHHSGTMIIGNVEIKVNDDWTDFGPFDYYEDDNKYEYPYKSPVVSGSRPFVRSAHYKSLMQQGLHEGCNLANPQTGYDWHIWTMSTSDANIINNTYSNADALQIKYSNTALHTTYTHLVGVEELNGDWLVMTLGGEVDANTRFQLVNSSAASTTDQKDIVATLGLSDFTTDRNNGGSVTAATFSDGQYHTIYYHMKGETFKSVYVDFSGVYSDPLGSRYMYITEIYLLEPAAKIEKKVDKEEAATGDELVYTLTVTNNDEQPITKFTVTDTLPEGVTFVSSSPAVSLGADGRTITWDYNDGAFQPDESRTLTVTVKVNTGFQGTLVNSGTITSLNGQEKAIGSNRVTTVVTAKTPEEFVFYAEVGQKTTLPIALGSTANSTTSTDTVEKTQSSVWLSYASGYGDGDYVTASGTVKLDSDGSIKITTNANGGISIRRIRLNDTTVLWMDNKQTKTASNVTVTGAVYFGSTDGGFAEGEIKNLKDGSIVISGLAAGDYTVEFLYRSWNRPAMDLTSITQETVTEPGEPAPDIVAGVPASSVNNAVVEANGITGQNSGNLLYTSRAEGKDTFEMTYNPGGDAAQTKTAKVTVYNYKVDNQIYVLDYGLPVNLTSGNSGFLKNAKLSIDGDNAGYAFTGLSTDKRNTDAVADPADYATPYGSATVEGSNGRADWNGMPNIENLSVTFTPTTFMSSIDIFHYGVQVTKNNTVASDAANATPVMEGEIKVMPANVVYYEDNFSHSGTDADGTNGIIYTGGQTVGGDDAFQWQTNDQNSPYGYDEEAYKNAIGDYSNGNAHELSINDTASFTFKGTGFDIIGRTNNKTGILMAMIYTEDQNEEGKMVFDKFIVVDTYYENGDLYQIPVISVLNLAYGKHRVDLYSLKGYADEYANQTSTVYIDGVRIYNPLGENGDEAYGDEQGAQFTEIKSMIFGSNFEYDLKNPENSTWTGGEPVDVMATLIRYDEGLYLNGATLVEILKNRNDASETPATEPGSTFDLLTYAFSGPNKELYLEDGYGIGFMPDGEGVLQIGVKLISRPGNTNPTIQYLDSDGGWKTLCVVNSSTEKYYSLGEIMGDLWDGAVILRVDGPGVVSLTNIKSKGYDFWPVDTEADNNGDPIETVVLKQEDLKVVSGYRNGKFAAGLINIRVTTQVADDITAVKIFDMDGTEITLQSMTFKDKDGVRTWTIKFKAKTAAQNYMAQVFNSAGNFSDQIKVK